MQYYLDSDCLLALLKPTDWLKAEVEAALTGAKGLATSSASVLECRYVLHRKGHADLILQIEKELGDREIELLPLTRSIILRSNELMRQHGKLGAFDSVHVATALAHDLQLVTSDQTVIDIGACKVLPIDRPGSTTG